MLPHTENNIALPTSNDMDHYRLVREVGRELNTVLGGKIPSSGLKECAKKLGLWKHGGIDVGRDGEVDVFFDYCIHKFRINNASIVQRHLLTSPPDADSIEFSILQTMLKSYYTIYTVTGVVEGKGIAVLDLLYQRDMFIIDISMSNTAMVGLVFAGNIVPFDQFYITTGANLIVPHELLNDKIFSIIEKNIMDHDMSVMLPKSKEASLAAQVIRAILKCGIWDSFGFKKH
jgi:hypothetical protein